MPRQVDFDEAAADRRLHTWAEEVTRAFTDTRPEGTRDHHTNQGFTIDELVALAKGAALAHDLIVLGEVDEIKKLFDAQLRRFGYIVGFLAHVGHRCDLSRGARDLVERSRSLPQQTLVVGVGLTPQGNGLFHGDEEAVRHFMRNRFFVRGCKLKQQRSGGRLKDRDIVQTEIKRCGFSVSDAAIRHALAELSQKGT